MGKTGLLKSQSLLRFVGPSLLLGSNPSPFCSRWSRACLNAAEINTSSSGRCSLPAGSEAAGSVTTATRFAALVPAAGWSNTLLCSLFCSFTPLVFWVSLYLFTVIFHLWLTDTDVCRTPWSNYRAGRVMYRKWSRKVKRHMERNVMSYRENFLLQWEIMKMLNICWQL